MLFQHIFSKNASQIGLRISEGIAPRTDQGQQPPKRASGNERALNPGGRGATPRDSLRPGFLLEKAWIPARDRAGTHLAGANLRQSKPGPPVRGSPVLRALWVGGSGRPAPARSRAGERCGTVYPSGGPGSYEASGRSAPLPRLPGGGPHFSREMGRKRAGGGAPWTPSFMARLLPLAHFGGRAALSRSWGYFAAHLRTLIWGLSFIKCFFSIFFTRKCVPNRS